MKLLHIVSLISLFFISSCANVSARPCKKVSHKGTCSIKIDQLRPTQFSLGMISIKAKTQEVEDAYNNGEIKEYLDSKVAPAIIGPDKNYYITDRHHTSFSIYNSNIPEKYKRLEIKVLHDWSKLSFNEFKKRMIDNKYVWLKDETHRKRDFEGLPKHITHLSDDPYRSLAWKVRKAKGFKKVKVSYLEFYWGIFFRENGIKLTSSDPDDIKLVLKKAKSLAKSKKASHLPGYKSK